MNIYVSNISFKSDENELREAFEKYGEVSSAKIIKDRDTGRSRGFGFVEMPDDSEAATAISSLNGANLGGRPLTVNEAKERN